MKKIFLSLLLFGIVSAQATERYFTYSYEPETMPAGVTELEQWITWRGLRDKAVGQENYNKWELREEFEYGVADNFSLSLYLNTSAESFRDSVTGSNHSDFDFDGVSVEARYMALNPAEHPVGLALYLEPRYSGEEAEVEQRIIFGQRHGDWKWALNITHATELANNLHTTDGEFEVSFGITRHLSKRWSLGIEARDHNEIPDYKDWENTAFFLGPVATYTQDKWWATLTVMPQVWGTNTSGGSDPDRESGLELEGHERVNARLIVGIGF